MSNIKVSTEGTYWQRAHIGWPGLARFPIVADDPRNGQCRPDQDESIDALLEENHAQGQGKKR